MSLKYAVEKVSDNHYVLPKVGAMKVEAHAFLSEALYQSSEEQVWKQIANGASYEGVIGAYLMPDTHTGYGVPVGSVLVTDGTIIQGGSGYDISCGVLYMKRRASTPAASGASTSASAGSPRSSGASRPARVTTRPDRMPTFSADKATRSSASARRRSA